MSVAASLPSEHKLAGREHKVAFRRALRGLLPDEILDGPKRGFIPPVGEWLRGELRGYAREVLLDPVARDRGYFRTDAVIRQLDRHEAEMEDNSRGIWNLLVFELWHRRFVDGCTSAAISPPAPDQAVAVG